MVSVLETSTPVNNQLFCVTLSLFVCVLLEPFFLLALVRQAKQAPGEYHLLSPTHILFFRSQI